MGNTFFYRQVKSGGDEITWKDIFSECRRKHTRQELEYALSAGTSMNQVSEADMLKKWQKPWVFYPLLKGGLLLVFLTYLILFATIFITGIVTTGLVDMVMIIPPIVIPFILLIFIWELNIPKNISIYELLAYFVFGGLLSFALTAFMYVFVGDGPGIFAASTAALREEPAKLFAAVILLLLFPKNKKIYGLTGLVVGAAVGAGFGGFESVEYAFMIQGEGFCWGRSTTRLSGGSLPWAAMCCTARPMWERWPWRRSGEGSVFSVSWTGISCFCLRHPQVFIFCGTQIWEVSSNIF